MMVVIASILGFIEGLIQAFFEAIGADGEEG